MHIFPAYVVTIIVLLGHHKSKGYFELVEESGCHDTEFRLSCKSLNAFIAIFNAIFSKNDSFLEPIHTPCGNSGHPPDKNKRRFYKPKNWENFSNIKTISKEALEVNFRHAINRRCSGVNYCSFVFSEDFDLAPVLGPGSIYLRYGCLNDLHISKACNSNIDASVEGFVKSPGYPAYYVGGSDCRWTFKASPFQRIRISFLDVSLRGIAPFERECIDWLTVTVNGLNLLSTCGDIIEDTVLISDGPALNVTFKSSSKTLFPKRGFFFHYKAVGCPSLPKPQDGYLISRNETSAHFKCCPGFVFPDTSSRDKILKCVNENTWDTEILDCVNITNLIVAEESSLSLNGKLTAEAEFVMGHIEDIVIPSFIITILLIGNGAVLYFIFRLKKKLDKNETFECTENVEGEAAKPAASSLDTRSEKKKRKKEDSKTKLAESKATE